MAPVTPSWLKALEPARCVWGAVGVKDGSMFEAWVCEIDFASHVGPRPDGLSLDCRKRPVS